MATQLLDPHQAEKCATEIVSNIVLVLYHQKAGTDCENISKYFKVHARATGSFFVHLSIGKSNIRVTLEIGDIHELRLQISQVFNLQFAHGLHWHYPLIITFATNSP